MEIRREIVEAPERSDRFDLKICTKMREGSFAHAKRLCRRVPRAHAHLQIEQGVEVYSAGFVESTLGILARKCPLSRDDGSSLSTHTIFEGTSEIQQLVIARAISGMRIE